jgi:hypothetical protein
MTIPAKPIIEPMDRSNSPAIMSSVAAAARMPISADTLRMLMMPSTLNMPLEPATAKKMA